ncbi:hypothetical protein [Paenibacillus lemnae]|uniref:DUF4871 domain-containing protein n=1 Tax=Paenibacillus lemnae TaxID=1330551 RepID=A0A848MA18_PAELE|nr:hypothetical protein [Paenibacillus lemnae]NMO97099.1 hypothetical protein [Paenibacillus lemnae]
MRFALLLFLLMFVLTSCSGENGVELEGEHVQRVNATFTSGQYEMLGQERKLGIIYDGSEVSRFYLGKTQKYMWYLWGDSKEFQGTFKVIASHQDNDEKLEVVKKSSIGGPLNGADAHIPSQISLPAEGQWRLDAYVNDVLFGSIDVMVHEG